MMLHLLAKHGKKPAVIVNTRHLDPNLVEGAILADIPVLCYPEQNPYIFLASCDMIEIDGESGSLAKRSPFSK